MQRISRYIEESWSELKKVTWPTPRQTWNLTVLVFVVSAMVGVFIFGRRRGLHDRPQDRHEPVTMEATNEQAQAPARSTGTSSTRTRATRRRSRPTSSTASSRWAWTTRSSRSWCPRRTRSRSAAASAVTVQKKVFPGYVLVEMILDHDSWFVVRNTPGVTSFVGGANIPGVATSPIPLDETEVKQILRQMGVEAPKIRVAFRRARACASRTARSPSSSARSTRSTRSATRSRCWSASSAARRRSSSTSCRSRSSSRSRGD